MPVKVWVCGVKSINREEETDRTEAACLVWRDRLQFALRIDHMIRIFRFSWGCFLLSASVYRAFKQQIKF